MNKQDEQQLWEKLKDRNEREELARQAGLMKGVFASDEPVRLNTVIETGGNTKHLIRKDGAYHMYHGEGDEREIVHVWLNQRQIISLIQRLALSLEVGVDGFANFAFYGEFKYVSEKDDETTDA